MMTEVDLNQRAAEILAELVVPISEYKVFMGYGDVILDGWFTIEKLKALVQVLERLPEYD